MDARHFDALTRVLSGGDSRRRFIAALATIPLLGGLLAILSPEDAEAKERRRRRKQRHKRRKHPGQRKGKRKKKPCKPESVAQTCAGKCGSALNTCKKAVDCGSCACDPPCAACLTCQEQGANLPGACVRDPAQTGEACGDPGQVCQPDGTCACDSASCPACTSCQAGQCVSCGDQSLLCCANQCVDGVCCEDAACAPGGDACDSHQCTCGGGSACSGSTPDCCGDPGGCTNIATDPANCGACDVACDAGLACCDGGCVDLQTDAGFCGSCDIACGANEICVDGACQACDVVCTGTAAECGAALQTALSGSQATLYVCPGTYGGGFSIARPVTVIGAGQGASPASNTILDGGGTQRVLLISSGAVTLHRLRVTGGNAGANSGGGIWTQGGALTMQDCTVTGSSGRLGGGITHNSSALTMTRCTVSNNTAPVGGGAASGGGLRLTSAATLTDCVITGNTTGGAGGGVHVGSFSVVILAGATLIQGNTANQGGGINSVVESPGSVTIGEDCRITGNTARSGDGGGIYRLTQGPVTLQGTDDPSPIVTNNCHENCAGIAIARCAATPVSC